MLSSCETGIKHVHDILVIEFLEQGNLADEAILNLRFHLLCAVQKLDGDSLTRFLMGPLVDRPKTSSA